jgi:hypothetical protein
MEDAPNARTAEGEYMIAGGSLKIKFKAIKERGFIDYSPANLSIEFNGKPVEACQEVTLHIGRDGVPHATLKFTLDEIEIDADVLTALEAYVEAKG